MKNRKQIAMLLCITMLLTFIFPTAALADVSEVDLIVDMPSTVTLGNDVTVTVTIPDYTGDVAWFLSYGYTEEHEGGFMSSNDETPDEVYGTDGVFSLTLPTHQITTPGIYEVDILGYPEYTGEDFGSIYGVYNGEINITEAAVIYTGGSYTPPTVKQLAKPIYINTDEKVIDPIFDEFMLHGNYRTGTDLIVKAVEPEKQGFIDTLEKAIDKTVNEPIADIESSEGDNMREELTMHGITYTIGDTVERNGVSYRVCFFGSNFVDLLDVENGIILRIGSNGTQTNYSADDSVYGELITVNGVTYQLGYRYMKIDGWGLDEKALTTWQYQILLTLEGEIAGEIRIEDKIGNPSNFRAGFAPADLKPAPITQLVVGPEEPVDEPQPIIAYTGDTVFEIQPIYAVSVSTQRNDKEVIPQNDGTADVEVHLADGTADDLLVNVQDRITGETRLVAAVDNQVYIADTSGNVDLIFAEAKTTYKNSNADVQPDDWYAEPVLNMTAAGIMEKDTKTTFGVNDNARVELVAQMLYQMAGAPKVTGGSHNMSISDTSPYYDAVTWLEYRGIIGEDIDVTQPASREEMVRMIWDCYLWLGSEIPELSDLLEQAENTNILSYEDAFDISEGYFEAIQFAVSAGIMGGYPDHTLKTTQVVTKAEAASMLDKTYELLVEYVQRDGVVEGYGLLVPHS